ncbi:MAG: hypothetical protein G3M70_16645 [Candidatus Nitronauta litoralis]|uniref:SH3 domain-containing protein n=1 Tax=Candidatus Nitronauta litoralis TaxID=2705533 RepID=A0A7T0BYQ9_9BACT|nr:MAG: hypothetical protein G3M70_16645 [Candidatus Nitronauta litoralis]
MNDSNSIFVLEKACTVHLKPEGEICNRLQKGRQVHLVQRKGSWAKITWRNGKKKGWVDLGLKDKA